MPVHELAGKPAPRELLVNVPRLVTAYYTLKPDPRNRAHQVSFGTSGHRGTSEASSFNEAHIMAVTQAICELRASRGISGPLFMGMDTHALSEAALATAVEVFAGNGTDIMIQEPRGSSITVCSTSIAMTRPIPGPESHAAIIITIPANFNDEIIHIVVQERSVQNYIVPCIRRPPGRKNSTAEYQCSGAGVIICKCGYKR